MWITVALYFSYIVGHLSKKNNGPAISSAGRAPSFTEEPQARMEFLNGSGASLPCSASGKPPSAIQWLLGDGSQVAQDVPGLRRTMPDGTLVFSPFTPDRFRPDVHDTFYRCAASNALGTVLSREIRLRAVLPQRYSVEMHDEFVLKGNTAVLRCQVPGFVRDLVHVEAWIKDPSENVDAFDKQSRYSVFPSGELHVRKVQQADALSSYSCRTKHRLTGETVDSTAPARIIVTEPYGEVPPRITHSASRVKVRSGETARLPCAGQASPPPTQHWFRREGGTDGGTAPLRPGGRLDLSGGTLVLRHAQPRDSGLYECTLNSAGAEDRAHTELVVTAPLSVRVSPGERTAEVGEAVSFNCSVRGHPIGRLRWAKDGALLEQGPRVRLMGMDRLLLSPVRREDRGIYQCLAASDFDSAQGAAQLHIGDHPPEFL